MSEREVGELVILLINLITLVLQGLLVSQCFVSLNKIHLFLSLILFNKLLIHQHFLSKIVKESLILNLFFLILTIFLFFFTIYLSYYMLQELFVVSF
jgi:hypothetical protein